IALRLIVLVLGILGQSSARPLRTSQSQGQHQYKPRARRDGNHPASCHSLKRCVTLARLSFHQTSSLMKTLSFNSGAVGSSVRVAGLVNGNARMFGTA